MKAQKLRGREGRNSVKVITLTIFMFFSTSADATSVWIDSVDVIPEQPLETDIITFDISGRASSSPSEVAYDEFTQNGTSLQLDLYINMGELTMISDWTCSKDILPLLTGTYTLEIRAFDNYDEILQDTYVFDFTVVPEPATLMIVAVGLPIFRMFARRKR